MHWKQVFARKSLETLLKEMSGEERLRRVLGPVSLTLLGVGAIIGSGIFVMTGRAAMQDAGPAIMLSYCVAGLGCALAAFCYAEFAALAPVAGSAYTYAYATLGEIFAWIIGWDLILEYAMSCATVASAWSNYFNVFLHDVFGWRIPAYLTTDPFSYTGGGFAINLPAVVIMGLVTTILVIGIRESAAANAVLTTIKLGVVLFVIVVGWRYVNTANWTDIPMTERRTPAESFVIPDLVKQAVAREGLDQQAQELRVAEVATMVSAAYRLEHIPEEIARLEKLGKFDHDQAMKLIDRDRAQYESKLAQAPQDQKLVDEVLATVRVTAPETLTDKWGILGYLGLNQTLTSIDDRVRSNFLPFGISGLMLGASIVFFAFIGFDIVATMAEETKNPQRDVPRGILATLGIVTVLYVGVSVVLSGMVPYTQLKTHDGHHANLATAFTANGVHWASGIISIGALAGLTTVVMVLLLGGCRVLFAMARDGLLPRRLAKTGSRGTPVRITVLVALLVAATASAFPTDKLEEMVNVGTLFAFLLVSAGVIILRRTRPDLPRGFRAPMVPLLPIGSVCACVWLMVNLTVVTWLRFGVWMIAGVAIYLGYGRRKSVLASRAADDRADVEVVP
jgi:APA family basic amino acid/polyamine antiporter